MSMRCIGRIVHGQDVRRIATMMIALILVVGCGKAEPTVTPVPSTATKIAVVPPTPPPPTATKTPAPTDTLVPSTSTPEPSPTPAPPTLRAEPQDEAATQTPLPPTVTPTPTREPTVTPTKTPFPTPTVTAVPWSGGLPILQQITVENADQVQLLAVLKLFGYQESWFSECSVAFSPDGSLLSGTCEINWLPVWDVPSLQLRHRLHETRQHTVACDFGPDGQMLACGNWDSSVIIWNPETGERVMDVGKHLMAPVWEVDFSPDGQLLVSCGSFGPGGLGDVRLWQISPRERLWIHEVFIEGQRIFPHGCLSISFHPSGETIAYSADAGPVEILDVDTGEPIMVLKDAESNIGDLTFSPSGNLLAAGCDDYKIFIWDTADYQLMTTLVGHQSYVNGVAFSADETLLVSGSDDKTVAIWALEGFRLLKQLEGHENTVLRVDINPDNTLIASISWDGTVRLWGIPHSTVGAHPKMRLSRP